jgi:uncharacterized protein YndB with AHSA1/START domain
MTVRVEASIDLRTDPVTAFAAAADLAFQERWVIATRLYPIEGEVSIPQVGSRLVAFTGLSGIGFLDAMVVTEYDPPWRWVMQHEGAFVMGVGIFEVTPTASGCRLTWAEELDLPFGLLGRLGWPLVKPIAHLGLLGCLRRLAKLLERGSIPVAAPAALRRDALPAEALAADGLTPEGTWP